MSELIPLVGILCVIGIPMMGLVIRFALTPLAEKITQAIQAADRDEVAELRERLVAMEELVETQQQELDRLQEAERFHRELSSEPSSG